MIFFKKRKLRVDILTIFLTLFIFTVACIVYYTQIRSNEAVLKLGNNLIEHSNQAIVDTLDGFLRPEPFIKVSRYLLEDHVLGMNDMESLSSFMHIILDSYPQLQNAYIADDKGNIFIENRVQKKIMEDQIIPFSSAMTIPDNTAFVSQIIHSNSMELHFKNEKGEDIKTQKNVPLQFDPRTRPWFVGAKLAGQEPWIGVYQFYGVEKSGITIAFSIFSDKKFVGVAGADLNIKEIENALKYYSISSKGLVFIINKKGQVIAHQDGTQQEEVSDVQTIHNQLIEKAYVTSQSLKQKNLTFSVEGTKYIAQFTPYSFNENERWEIGSIIPLDTFVGSLDRANQNTLIFSVIMLLLGVVVVIFSSHKISRPIMRLAKETKDISNLHFDKEIKIKTHIYEVQILIDALNATKSALSSFAKYVPKTLVEQLLKTRQIAQLGGEKKTITALFTDIENFTEVAEKTDPEFLMLHLSEYLNVLTQRIQACSGNIDKYMGDAIMAFWNAPLNDTEHVVHACKAVLACQRDVKKLNDEWRKSGKPLLPTRFALHTGVAIVGNMGSADRLNYTALGDAINLAARLQDINKIYHTEIIVSQSTYELCFNKFLFRPLDTIQVRGKSQATTIYELIAEKRSLDFPPTPKQIELCELSTQAYEAFQKNDVDRACSLFKKILEKFPNDGMARIYLERCEK